MSDTSPVHDFVQRMLTAIANASLYGPAHPQVARMTEKACSALQPALEARDAITLMVVDGDLVIDGTPQTGSLFMGRMSKLLTSVGIGHLQILNGIDQREIKSLISYLAGIQRDDGTQQQPPSGEHLRIGHLEVRLGDGSGGSGTTAGATGGQRRISLPDMPRQELDRFMEVYDTVKSHRRLKITGIMDTVSGFIQILRQEGRSLLVMSALKNSDSSSFTHSANVCVLNMAQAMALGIQGQQLVDIGVASLLHDVGKMFIPEELLVKSERLDAAEVEIMRAHSVRGARYLMGIPDVPRLAVTVAYEHHLRYNLTGYPTVPAGWQQNICSHMTMISDLFDSLRSKRAFRDAVPLQAAGTLMKQMAGQELHPDLTRNFLRILSRLIKETPAQPA